MNRRRARRPWALTLAASLLGLSVAVACGGGGGGTTGISTEPNPTLVTDALPCEGGLGLAGNTGPSGVSASLVQQADKLIIGVVIPSTGAQSAVGSDYLNAANLAAKCLNNAGGVNGGPVVILTVDTAASSDHGIEEAGRLVDVEGVVAFMGAASPSVTVALAEAVSIPQGVLQISPAPIEPDSAPSEDNDLLFGMRIALDGDAGEEFDAAFVAEYGAIYTSPSVREVFDAIIVIGLAAQAASSNTDSLAIRDRLRDVANAPGTEYGPGEADIEAALLDVLAGGDVDYQGASGSVDFG